MTTEEAIKTAKEHEDAVMSGKDRLDYNNGNVIFDYVARKRKYNQLPQVIDAEMFDKLKKESPVGVVYRGISAKTKEQALSYASDFKYGKMYSGKAYVYGSGTYFSPDEKVAQKYSQDGVMLVAILSKDAKVVDYKEIIKEYSSTGANVAKLKRVTIQRRGKIY